MVLHEVPVTFLRRTFDVSIVPQRRIGQNWQKERRDRSMRSDLVQQEEQLLTKFLDLSRRAVAASKIGDHHEAQRTDHLRARRLSKRSDRLEKDLGRLLQEKEIEAGNRDSLTLSCLRSQYLTRYLLRTVDMSLKVTDIEERLNLLSCQISDRACELIEATEGASSSTKVPPVSAADLMQASQNKISALRDSWRWLKKLAYCTEVHLEKASDYHVFYQSVHEFKKAMDICGKQMQSDLSKEDFAGDHEEANRFYITVQEMLSLFLQWWQRIDVLISQSRKIFPLKMRKTGIDMKRPGVMLVDYDNKEKRISLRAGENLFVLDNQDRSTWTVETMRGFTVKVPAICVLLTGPDTEAIEKAMTLRVELLASWTVAIKELGKTLIGFMLSVFRHWNKEENQLQEALCEGVQNYPMGTAREVANSLQSSLELSSKEEIMTLLKLIENILQSYWADNPDFENLKERMRSTRAALVIYEDDEPVDDRTKIDINTIFLQISPIVMLHGSASEEEEDEEAGRSGVSSFVLQKRILSLLLNKYEEFHKYWEIYKMLVESASGSSIGVSTENLAHGNSDERTAELLSFISSEDKEVWSRYIAMLVRNRKQGGPTPLFDVPGRPPARLRPAVASKEVRLDPGGSAFRVCRSPHRLSPRPGPVPGAQLGGPQMPEMPGRHNQSLLLDEDEDKWQKTTYNMVVNRDEIIELADADAEAAVFETHLQPPRSSISHPRSPSPHPTPKFVADVVASVEDSSSGSRLALGAARQAGLVSDDGTHFLDRRRGIWLALSQAVSAGLVVLKKSSAFGYLTVRHVPPAAYKVLSVQDKAQRQQLSPAAARRTGVLDEAAGTVLDTFSKKRLDFDEAVAAGLVKVKMDTSVGSSLEEKSFYVIRRVHDPKCGGLVPFGTAVAGGIVDRRHGLYLLASGEYISLLDAIQQDGLVEAERVSDTVGSKGVIAENQMTVFRLKVPGK